MATLISAATGNLTNAGTWKKVAAAGLLESTGSTTALDTTNRDSATFVLGATAVDAVALKLASRASGSPSNTITVHLRNSTTATNVLSLTINVSDLPACTTTDVSGGWIVFAFGSSHTPNGTDNYVIRVTMSATTTAVSLYTNGTANNWARMVRETTTQAPAAGDNMNICGEHTGAGTGNDYTVTMDSTASTDYGAASTNVNQSALDVCKRGTLKFGTTAATNYIIRLSGNAQVYSGGTLSVGDGTTQMPRDSSGIIEFDCAADGDFGLYVRSGSTCNLRGLSRTSGKDVVVCKLNADAAAAATTLNVDTDTGWLNGDEIALASTSRTASEFESRTLNANAGSSSMTISAGLTNAHGGSTSSKVQAEVVLLTRNVKVRSVSSTAMSFLYVGPTATFNFQWAEFRYLGTNATNKHGLEIDNTTAFTIRYCVVRDGESDHIIVTNAAHSGWSIRDTVSYNSSNATNRFAFNVAATSGSGWTVSDVVVLGSVTGGNALGVRFDDLDGTISNLTVTSTQHSNQTLFNDLAKRGWSCSGLTYHSNGATWNWGDAVGDGTISNGLIWRNNGAGLTFAQGIACHNITFSSVRFFGNSVRNITVGSGGTGVFGFYLKDCQFSGDSTFATTTGIEWNIGGSQQSSNSINWRFDTCTFGVASGIYVAHSTEDLKLGGVSVALGQCWVDLTFVNCTLASSTELTNFLDSRVAQGSAVRFQHHDATAGDNKAITPNGTLSYETTTVDVSPSLKMTPTSATHKLESNASLRGRGFLFHVNSGQTRTISVKVRKDGSYAGNAPRLVVKTNPAIGITSDTVLDTLSVGANTWETLSGTTSAASATGVIEAIVDCDGTAGAVYVDTVSVT